jgi:molybdenum cofactor cytidylyltransferase
MGRLGAILLAAGRSSRFGSDNKLLADIDGRPMVRVVANALLGAACIDEVLVVTGHDAPAIERALANLSVRFCFNADWHDGMGTSIALGIAGVSTAVAGVAIVPADMPFISQGLIERLASRFQELGSESIIFPATPAGEQRSPVIWPRRFFGLLEDLSGPEGGKRLLRDLADSCGAVRIADEKVLLDIDAPDDMSGPSPAGQTNC